jgi:aspartate ammonia-lyase
MRTERDSLGELQLPAGVYHGIQTARAVANFPISGRGLPTPMIRAMGLLKLAAARTHQALGELAPEVGGAIEAASREVLEGKLDDAFVVDAFQAGAGTSFHMNANEVIANRANELLGRPLGSYDPIHPNDHVNMGQSTNDVFPSAMRLAALLELPRLDAALAALAQALHEKGRAFAHVIKSGRTHLQDAVPVTLGQELGAYAVAVRRCRAKVQAAAGPVHELGLGGSAAGTGMNTLPAYREAVVAEAARLAGLPLRPAEDPFEAMQSMAPIGDLSAALRGTALELTRVANDFRLLASGPRTGFDEVLLPAVQPGSSIMPGKINPSMAEMLNQVCFQVLGNDTAIAYAVQAGQLELNVMMPVAAFNLLNSITWLANAVDAFTQRCVVGLVAREETCRAHAFNSVGLATALNPLIGYQAAAEVVKQAVKENRSIAEVVIERGLMTADQAAKAFSPESLTKPGKLSL